MIFRNSDGLLVDIKRSDFKNDQLFYSKIMSIKVKKERKQQTVHSALMVKTSTNSGLYSKQAIDKLMLELS
ncbi:MAG: hypothetical protein EBY20_00300 [Alphaproteobacteria bacterium]|jgi:hypothetical protein|uniref:Uncharacterized protein n=1 Tax=viral metagenome TaxID=1070528 RepID=A0A6C0HQ54_9ZZZZ|nr:hypothetical protein [Alphaproteobacteria bacterium]